MRHHGKTLLDLALEGPAPDEMLEVFALDAPVPRRLRALGVTSRWLPSR